MSVTLGYPRNTRRLQDYNLQNTIALPAAASTIVNGGAINLGQPGAQPAYWNTQSNPGFGGSQPSGATNAPNGAYVATEKVLLIISSTASTNGNNGANGATNISLYLQQTGVLANGAADTSNWVNMPGRSQIFGGAVNAAYVNLPNGGNAAASYVDQLPPGNYQFIRLQAQSGTGTNNAADATMTLSIGF